MSVVNYVPGRDCGICYENKPLERFSAHPEETHSFCKDCNQITKNTPYPKCPVCRRLDPESEKAVCQAAQRALQNRDLDSLIELPQGSGEYLDLNVVHKVVSNNRFDLIQHLFLGTRHQASLSIFMGAASFGHVDVLERLFPDGVDTIPVSQKTRGLREAAKHGQLSVVEYLI